ncbi:hypothetical protein GCM10027321_01540 [Massilia terrae]|uniref:Uncharacterized protein n=1 Tax=Massilia terrae TaxID=1811224 RepID=A0ABT2CUG5_9BURK|nr:hypothetical protein [Massilia terrae]MCS0657484.1 hypothetical protein [Massilia terrae]
MASNGSQRDSAQPVRSDKLLPPGDDDGDGRFDVAEEVNLDQQSDSARHIGQAPDELAPGVPNQPPRPPGATR